MTKLRLYVTGHTPTADAVVAKIRAIMDTDGEYELEVVDVFQFPDKAYDDMVLATPTLIRVLPTPIRRLVGDLSDRERVLAGLEVIGNGNGGESSSQ